MLAPSSGAGLSSSAPPSLSACIQSEVGALLHAHVVRLRALLVRQGCPSPGLFLIVRGQVCVHKEMEIIATPATHDATHSKQATNTAAAAAAATGATAGEHSAAASSSDSAVCALPAPCRPRSLRKPLQVALLGAGDYCGDLGCLDVDRDSPARRSPVTVMASSAELHVLFLKRADLRALSKPLLRALRAHSAQRLEAHMTRVSRLLATLAPSVAGELRGKQSAASPQGGGSMAAAAELFWSNSGQQMQQTVAMAPTTAASVSSSPSSPTGAASLAAPAATAVSAGTAATAVSSATLESAASPFASMHAASLLPAPSSPRRNAAAAGIVSGNSPPSAAALVSSSSANDSSISSQSALAARRRQRDKAREALADSLARRYTAMKLRAQRLFFPDRLLERIRDFVTAEAAAGGRVTKQMGSLLAVTHSRGGAGGSDASAIVGGVGGGVSGGGGGGDAELERAQKDELKFLADCLRSADSRRPMHFASPGVTAGSAVSARPEHMAALLRNDHLVAQARFEEQAAATKLGALDSLLKEERARQQAQRDAMLGQADSSSADGPSGSRTRSKSAGAATSPRKSLVPAQQLPPSSGATPRISLSLSSTLANGSRGRGGAAVLHASQVQSAREEREILMEQRRLQSSLRMGVPTAAAAAAAAINDPSSGSATMAMVGPPSRSMFAVNRGLNAEFLAGESASISSAPSLPLRGKSVRRKEAAAVRAAALDSANATPDSSLHHRFLAAPPDAATKLLSSLYGVASPALTGSERFGKDLEQLPSAPARPQDWDAKVAAQRAREHGEDDSPYTVASCSEGAGGRHTPAASAARALMADLLSSPAASAARHAAHHADEQTPHTYAEEHHTFSGAAKAPLSMRRREELHPPRPDSASRAHDGVTHPSASAKHRKQFLPNLHKAASPLVLLQAMPSPLAEDGAAGSSPTGASSLPAPDTPQGILLKQQAARDRAEALVRSKSLALRPRSSLSAAEQFEVDRMAALQAFSLEAQGSRGIMASGSSSSSDEKYAPQPLPLQPVSVVSSGIESLVSDEFLARQFRVASYVDQKQGRGTAVPASTKSGMGSKSTHVRTASGMHWKARPISAAKTVALPPPERAIQFAQEVQQRLEDQRAHSASNSPTRAQPAGSSALPSRQTSSAADAHRRVLSILPEESSSVAGESSAQFASTAMELPVVPDHPSVPRASTAPLGGSATERYTSRPSASALAPRPPTGAHVSASSSTARSGRATRTSTRPAATSGVKLSDPSMRLIGSQGVVRARKEGDPPRFVSRSYDAEDASVALMPLTAALLTSPRSQLLAAVRSHADHLRAKAEARDYERAHAPPPKPTAMIRCTPAALHVTHKLSSVTRDGGEPEEKHSSDPAPGSELALRIDQKNVPRLDIAASIPPPPLANVPSPRKMPVVSAGVTAAVAAASADTVPSVASTGTQAAAGGLLASSMSPLSDEMSANGLDGKLTVGLTTVAQMLPATTAARKLTQLYAHYQRHLARSADYFVQQQSHGQTQKKRHAQTTKDGAAAPQSPAAAAAVAPLSPCLLHRVDSTGAILGPDRSTPSLAPNAMMVAAGSGSAAASAASAATDGSSASGPHRRGGHLGMLDGQSLSEQAESIQVLAEMIAHAERTENEQALRVLNSFDRQELTYLPPVLLARAQELHALLNKRAEEAAAAKTAARVAAAEAAAATLANLSDASSSGDDGATDSAEDDLDPSDPFHAFALRALSRRKAQAKFRLVSSQRCLGGSGEQGHAKRRMNRSAARAAKEALLHAHAEEQELREKSMAPAQIAELKHALDVETAQRVIQAVAATAETETVSRAATPHSPGLSSSAAGPKPSTAGSASRIPASPLPPSFASLYSAWGVEPSRDGSGLACRPTAAAASSGPSSGGAPSLLDVVTARANLERKLRQDDFVLKHTGGSRPDTALTDSSGASGGAEQAAAMEMRMERLAELHGLQLEEAAERSARISAQTSTIASSAHSPAASTRSLALGSQSLGSPAAASGSRMVHFPSASAVSASAASSALVSSDESADDDDELDVDQALQQMAHQRKESIMPQQLQQTVAARSIVA